jgi:ketosteroid isomerase-like protein
MKKIDSFPYLLPLCLAAALSAIAQAPSASEKEVRAVEQQRYKAMLDADFAALDKLLADDLLYAHSSGDVDDKKSLIAGMRSGSRRYKKITPEDTRYRVDAKLAVVTGKASLEVERDGKPQSFRVRFTAVYEKAPSGWRLAAWQTTRLPEP